MERPYFNVRVYGLLFNEQDELLLTDENRFGMQFTKFPGGGLEFGEGTVDCLKREFKEEMDLDITIHNHFYTTDFFVPSAFNPAHQVLSIYYRIGLVSPWALPLSSRRFDFKTGEEGEMLFRFKSLHHIQDEELDFPIDRKVLQLLKESI